MYTRVLLALALVVSGCTTILPAATAEGPGPSSTPVAIYVTPQPTPVIIYVTPVPATAPATPWPTQTPSATPVPTDRATPTSVAGDGADDYNAFLTYTKGQIDKIDATVKAWDTSDSSSTYETGDELAQEGNDGMAWINDHPADACYAGLSDATFFFFSDTSLLGIDLLSDSSTLKKDSKTWKRDSNAMVAALDLVYC